MALNTFARLGTDLIVVNEKKMRSFQDSFSFQMEVDEESEALGVEALQLNVPERIQGYKYSLKLTSVHELQTQLIVYIFQIFYFIL